MQDKKGMSNAILQSQLQRWPEPPMLFQALEQLQHGLASSDTVICKTASLLSMVISDQNSQYSMMNSLTLFHEITKFFTGFFAAFTLHNIKSDFLS